MLREFWAKLKGKDKWPEVSATVRSVELFDEPSYARYELPRKLANLTFAYTDGQGSLQYGWITVQDSSDLYDAKEGDTFSIRVDPSHPEQYFSSEATHTEL